MLRNAIGAFMRVFDALWRRGARLIRGAASHTSSLASWIPALRSSVKSAAPRPGHGAHGPCATHTHAIVNGKLPSGGTFPKECCFQVIYFVLNIFLLAAD
jgi:hypothetical protein